MLFKPACFAVALLASAVAYPFHQLDDAGGHHQSRMLANNEEVSPTMGFVDAFELANMEKKFNVEDMLTCLAAEQRALVRKCKESVVTSKKSHWAPLRTDNPAGKDAHVADEVVKNEETVTHMKSRTTHFVHKAHGRTRQSSVPECLLTSTGAVNNMTGHLNLTIFRGSFIDLTSLSVEQKNSTFNEMQLCIKSNTSSLDNHQHLLVKGTSASVDRHKNDIGVHVMRVFSCTARALIQNGCSDSSMSRAALTELIGQLDSIEDLSYESLPEDASSEETSGAY